MLAANETAAARLAEESAGQCGPCYLGLPAAARGMEDILNGGGPAALEALKQVAKAVKRRGACCNCRPLPTKRS